MNRVAEAQIRVRDAQSLTGRICAHLVEHGVVIRPSGDVHEAVFPFGIGQLRPQAEFLHLRVEAKDLNGLHNLRLALAAHVKEFAAAPEPEIVWTGDGSALLRPPNFRVLRVLSHHDVTPRMRRIVFSGEDLDYVATSTNLHVRLLIPAEDRSEPEWPTLGRDGLIAWPDPARLVSRRYTIRRFDLRESTITVDFALHHNAGPGADFAARAQPGAVVGMIGPGGGSVPLDRDWYLLAGDETALPAIARILESLPEGARGTALIEVEDPGERQELAAPAAFDLRWLYRDRDPATALADCTRAAAFPPDAAMFVWAGCEFDTFRSIRSFIRDEHRLPKSDHLIVSYWRRGVGEGEA